MFCIEGKPGPNPPHSRKDINIEENPEPVFVDLLRRPGIDS
jgi:hypothetical protein